MKSLTETQRVRYENREECNRIRDSLKFIDRIFCDLGDEKGPFYVRQIPENCHKPDLDEMKKHESQMEKNPDSYLVCRFAEYTDNHQESHHLRVKYHQTGLKQVIEEIEGRKK